MYNRVDTQSLLGQATPDANKSLSSVPVLHNKTEDNSRIADRNIMVGEGQQLWVPFFLRRRTLLLFASLFIVLLAALATLWRVSEIEHGLSRADSNNHYLWTYGPTAGKCPSKWQQICTNALKSLCHCQCILGSGRISSLAAFPMAPDVSWLRIGIRQCSPRLPVNVECLGTNQIPEASPFHSLGCSRGITNYQVDDSLIHRPFHCGRCSVGA